MAKLFMTIKREYFDEIKAGTKTEEYRLVKPHWINKLVGKEYTHIIFQNRYSTDAPRIEVEYLGYEIKNITHEFFGDEEISVFALKLGQIIYPNLDVKRNGKAYSKKDEKTGKKQAK